MLYVVVAVIIAALIFAAVIVGAAKAIGKPAK